MSSHRGGILFQDNADVLSTEAGYFIFAIKIGTCRGGLLQLNCYEVHLFHVQYPVFYHTRKSKHLLFRNYLILPVFQKFVKFNIRVTYILTRCSKVLKEVRSFVHHCTPSVKTDPIDRVRTVAALIMQVSGNLVEVNILELSRFT